MAKIKELCKIRAKEFDLYYDDIVKIVRKPKYICSKCLRVAKKESLLCTPVEIKKKK